MQRTTRRRAQTPAIDVEALLKETENTAADDVKAALEEAAAMERKAKRDQLVGQLKTARQNTLSAVEQLRSLRAQEKKQKATVELFAQAEKRFHDSADWDKYQEDQRSIVYHGKLSD